MYTSSHKQRSQYATCRPTDASHSSRHLWITGHWLAGGVFAASTNNHVLPDTDAEFLTRTVFTFECLGPIRLTKDDIKCCTISKELDATVIELTEQCVKRLQQFKAKFIKLTTAREGDKIAMAQYPEGEFSFDKGAIHEIKDNKLYYYLGGAASSCGSPILLWEYKAIGMHKQSGSRVEHRPSSSWNEPVSHFRVPSRSSR